MKAALLEEVLEPAEPRDELPLAARAAAFGLDFSGPARMLVIRPEGVRREVSAALERAGAPHLTYRRDGGEHVDCALEPGRETRRDDTGCEVLAALPGEAFRECLFQRQRVDHLDRADLEPIVAESGVESGLQQILELEGITGTDEKADRESHRKLSRILQLFIDPDRLDTVRHLVNGSDTLREE